MPVIEEIVGGEYAHKHHYEHNHGNTTVAFSLLHGLHIRRNGVVGTTLAEELYVNGIVVRIQIPVV